MADTKGSLIGFLDAFPQINVNEDTASITIGFQTYGLDQVGGTEVCKYMYGKAGATTAQWQPNTFDPTVSSLATGIQPTTASLNCFMGLAAGSGGITAAQFGWFLVKGKGKVLVDGSGVAIVNGDSLKCANASFNMVHDAAKGSAPAFASYVIANAASVAAGATIAATVMSNL